MKEPREFSEQIIEKVKRKSSRMGGLLLSVVNIFKMNLLTNIEITIAVP